MSIEGKDTQVQASAAQECTTKRSSRSVLKNVAAILAVAISIGILVSALWLPILRIYGSSMSPTIRDGEVVVLAKTSAPDRGDILAFYYNNKILMKRVIGLPGDQIEIAADGTVSVNGTALEEPYTVDRCLGECDLEFPYQVPEGMYFVMGDHRETSVDSRSTTVGCVPAEQILGRVTVRIWPLLRFKIFFG